MSYTKYTPSAGLSLSPDSSPLSSTLNNNSYVINETLYVSVGDYWDDNSYGLDLGSAKMVDRLIVYCEVEEGSTPTSWGSVGGTFYIYYSSDNSTWTLLESFVQPTMENVGAGTMSFTLELVTPTSARYWKIRQPDNFNRVNISGGYCYYACGEVEAYTEDLPENANPDNCVLTLVSSEPLFAVPGSSALLLFSDEPEFASPGSSYLYLVSSQVAVAKIAYTESSIFQLFSKSVTIIFTPPMLGDGIVDTPTITVLGYTGSEAEFSTPTPIITGTAIVTTFCAGSVSIFSAFTLEVQSGFNASVKSSIFDFSGECTVGTAPGDGGGNVKVPVPTVLGTAMVGVLADGEILFPGVTVLGGRAVGEVGADGSISFYGKVAGTALAGKSAEGSLLAPGCTIAGTAGMAQEADGVVVIDQFTVAAVALSNAICSSRLEYVR